MTLPSGRRTEREVVEHPGSVAVVAVTGDQSVLLVEQHRVGAGEPLLEVPAGTLAAGETPEACARRELAEETGYLPRRLQRLAGFFVSPGYSTEFMHLYLATELEAVRVRPGVDEDEELTVHRLSLDEAVQRVREGTLRDAKSVAGLLLAAHHLSTR